MWPSWILMAWMAVVCYWVDPSPRLRTGNVAGLHRLLRRQHLRCCDPWSAGISQWMIENSSNSSSFWCSPPETSGESQNSDAQLESFVFSMTFGPGMIQFLLRQFHCSRFGSEASASRPVAEIHRSPAAKLRAMDAREPGKPSIPSVWWGDISGVQKWTKKLEL